MQLYPAIDLRDGRCVRLRQGDYAAETVYDDDPVAVARSFAAAGARWLHVVDLDAARTGEPENLAVVEAICAAVPCSVQAGGGVRSAEAAGALLASGVARLVVGTAAVERPVLIEELCAMHPGKVAVGLDARGRAVAVRGWQDTAGLDLLDLAGRFDAVGVAALVVTEIGRDGMLEGPDIGQLRSVLGTTGLALIASGGIASVADLTRLRDLRVGGRSLAGVIVGTALYEGRFTLEQALAAVE